MNAEPQLEELSAYLDQQLAEGARVDLEAHLGSCDTCRRRLDALRRTVSAIRALPMESPPRRFSIPARRREARWAPPAWAGAAAAAGLVLIVGAAIALQPGRHLLSSGSPASLPQTVSQGAGTNPPREIQGNDQTSRAQFAPVFRNAASASNPSNPTQRLTLATERSSYQVDGTLVVRLTQQGAPYAVASPGTLSASGIRLALVREGYSVDIGTPLRTSSSSSGPTIDVTYRISDLPLASPQAGNYRLVATWSLPNAPGTALVAEVPVQLEG